MTLSPNNPVSKKQSVAVIIPTWRRGPQLKQTLERILECNPAPDAIYVHVDAGDCESSNMLAHDFRNSVKVISSETTQGPGGGRNLLFAASGEDILVSLDDDSWPLDPDFFGRVRHWMSTHEDAAALAMTIVLKSQSPLPSVDKTFESADFENCGVAFRRRALAGVQGFLPLRYAYGMEESDLRLQLLDRDWRIFHCQDLRVYHDTDYAHHPSSGVNAAYITNLALLGFLRYPLLLWPLALLQVGSRVLYCLKSRRLSGIVQGIITIPAACIQHRRRRQVVSWRTIGRTLKLQKSSAARIAHGS